LNNATYEVTSSILPLTELMMRSRSAAFRFSSIYQSINNLIWLVEEFWKLVNI